MMFYRHTWKFPDAAKHGRAQNVFSPRCQVSSLRKTFYNGFLDVVSVRSVSVIIYMVVGLKLSNILFFFFFWDGVSCSLGWHLPAFFISQELANHQTWLYVVLGIEPRVSGTLASMSPTESYVPRPYFYTFINSLFLWHWRSNWAQHCLVYCCSILESHSELILFLSLLLFD